MHGSPVKPELFPRPDRLALRLLIAGALILWPAFSLQAKLVQPILPLMGAAVELFSPDVRVLDVALSRDGANQTVRFKLNFARPVSVGAYTVRPYGWPGMPNGAIEVNLGVTSLLQYASLLLILVAAWPREDLQELGARLLISVPLALALVLLPAAWTALSLLWGPFQAELAPQETWPILIWSRFLSGGGGLMIAGILSLVTIVLGRRRGAE